MEVSIEAKSFLDVYQNEIAPKLRQIDLTIKTLDKPLSRPAVCKLLGISRHELNDIMEQNKINQIDKLSFFTVMQNGTSEICKLFRREIECGSPYTYEREKIAYIYNLKADDVNSACEKLGIIEATPFTLPVLFSQIPIYE